MLILDHDPSILWKTRLPDFFGLPLPPTIHTILLLSLQTLIATSPCASAALRGGQHGQYIPACKPAPRSRSNNIIIPAAILAAQTTPQIPRLDLNFTTNPTLLQNAAEFVGALRGALTELSKLRWIDLPQDLREWPGYRGEKDVRGRLKSAVKASEQDAETLNQVANRRIRVRQMEEPAIGRGWNPAEDSMKRVEIETNKKGTKNDREHEISGRSERRLARNEDEYSEGFNPEGYDVAAEDQDGSQSNLRRPSSPPTTSYHQHGSDSGDEYDEHDEYDRHDEYDDSTDYADTYHSHLRQEIQRRRYYAEANHMVRTRIWERQRGDGRRRQGRLYYR